MPYEWPDDLDNGEVTPVEWLQDYLATLDGYEETVSEEEAE